MKGKASPVIISSDFGLGRIEIVKNDSTLMVYNLEIAFVNMLKPTYDTDFEQFILTIKGYVAYPITDTEEILNKFYTGFEDPEGEIVIYQNK
ncbi:hypothetical protein Q3E60_13055 [Enterococcus faecium]|nr:hypothetical protein [Enterococcus faecium]